MEFSSEEKVLKLLEELRIEVSHLVTYNNELVAQNKEFLKILNKYRQCVIDKGCTVKEE